MRLNDLLEVVGAKGIFLSREYTKALYSLEQGEYDQVVSYLLTENFPNTPTRRVNGCIFFTVRPNLALYPLVLAGTLDIDDPSSVRDGVVALLQVKSADNIAEDLLIQLEDASDTQASRILSMFYWMGFEPQSLLRNNAWPGYTTDVYFGFLAKELKFRSRHISKVRLTPEANREHAKDVSLRIISKMLALFEQNNANQTAREIISLLYPNPDFPTDIQARIREMRRSARQSTDEYVRHRVSHETF
jgi:hypothetical protein